MPSQIKRLLLLFAIFIGLFLIIRQLLIPATFGEYGYYRGASLGENAGKIPHYAGHTTCGKCHADIVQAKGTDLHADLACEICHGPCAKHVLNPHAFKVEKPSGRDFCAVCHSYNPAKDKNVINQIDPKVHNIGKQCIECHNPHKPWDLKNQKKTGDSLSKQP